MIVVRPLYPCFISSATQAHSATLLVLDVCLQGRNARLEINVNEHPTRGIDKDNYAPGLLRRQLPADGSPSVSSAGRSSVTGRPLRGGQTRSKHNLRATVSPAAMSLAFAA